MCCRVKQWKGKEFGVRSSEFGVPLREEPSPKEFVRITIYSLLVIEGRESQGLVARAIALRPSLKDAKLCSKKQGIELHILLSYGGIPFLCSNLGLNVARWSLK